MSAPSDHAKSLVGERVTYTAGRRGRMPHEPAHLADRAGSPKQAEPRHQPKENP